jgi:hypothetical protein
MSVDTKGLLFTDETVFDILNTLKNQQEVTGYKLESKMGFVDLRGQESFRSIFIYKPDGNEEYLEYLKNKNQPIVSVSLKHGEEAKKIITKLLKHYGGVLIPSDVNNNFKYIEPNKRGKNSVQNQKYYTLREIFKDVEQNDLIATKILEHEEDLKVFLETEDLSDGPQ